MFYILLFTSSAIIGSILYLDGHLVLSETIQNNYKQLQRLHNASKKVAKIKQGKKVDKWKIIKITFETILQKLWLNLAQKMNNSVKILRMGVYEVSYTLRGKMYKIIIVKRNGPCPILQINNENYEDITQKVLPYMGPNYDWHGAKFTPEFFGCHSMNFELSNGETFIYKRDQHINHSHQLVL